MQHTTPDISHDRCQVEGNGTRESPAQELGRLGKMRRGNAKTNSKTELQNSQQIRKPKPYIEDRKNWKSRPTSANHLLPRPRFVTRRRKEAGRQPFGMRRPERSAAPATVRKITRSLVRAFVNVENTSTITMKRCFRSNFRGGPVYGSFQEMTLTGGRYRGLLKARS